MNKSSLIFSLLLLTACTPEKKTETVIFDGEPENTLVDISAIPDAVPQYEPWSASVNPDSYVVLGKTYHVLRTNKDYHQQGIASWYGTKFHQKKTATGEVYDMWAMTAAHKTLPIPSYVQVTNIENQRSVIVKVNDRGPFHAHRVIDLSYAAAVRLGLDKAGTGFVDIKAVQPGDSKTDLSVKLNNIYYQVGAFKTQENARLLQEKLASVNLVKNRIVPETTSVRTLYKVQLGPITSVGDADIISAKLKQLGMESGHYISE